MTDLKKPITITERARGVLRSDWVDLALPVLTPEARARRRAAKAARSVTIDGLLTALRDLHKQAGHLSPFVGIASVRSIRQAAKFMSAYDSAGRIIELAERGKRK